MSSPKASGGLNPDMVYRPVPSTPPLAPENGGNNSYLRVDESEDPKYRLRVRLAWIIRCCFAWLAFGALLGLMIIGALDRGRNFTIVIFIELWFLLIWQLLNLFPKLFYCGGGHGGGGLLRLLPRISLQIGDASCVLGGDGDDNRDREYYSRPPGKNLMLWIATCIDFSFGVTLIVFGALWCSSGCPYQYGWPGCNYFAEQHIASVIISIILGSFMVIASYFSLFKVYHTMAFELSLYKDGTVQPISLGHPDTEVSSRREPVSISA